MQSGRNLHNLLIKMKVKIYNLLGQILVQFLIVMCTEAGMSMLTGFQNLVCISMHVLGPFKWKLVCIWMQLTIQVKHKSWFAFGCRCLDHSGESWFAFGWRCPFRWNRKAGLHSDVGDHSGETENLVCIRMQLIIQVKQRIWFAFRIISHAGVWTSQVKVEGQSTE